MRSRQYSPFDPSRRVEQDGDRHLLSLRISAVLAALICFGWGAITSLSGDPDPLFHVWILPVVIGLAALVLRRDPRRRSPELSFAIVAVAWLGFVVSAVVFLVRLDPLFTTMFVLCVITLVLSYVWRGGRGARR